MAVHCVTSFDVADTVRSSLARPPGGDVQGLGARMWLDRRLGPGLPVAVFDSYHVLGRGYGRCASNSGDLRSTGCRRALLPKCKERRSAGVSQPSAMATLRKSRVRIPTAFAHGYLRRIERRKISDPPVQRTSGSCLVFISATRLTTYCKSAVQTGGSDDRPSTDQRDRERGSKWEPWPPLGTVGHAIPCLR